MRYNFFITFLLLLFCSVTFAEVSVLNNAGTAFTIVHSEAIQSSDGRLELRLMSAVPAIKCDRSKDWLEQGWRSDRLVVVSMPSKEADFKAGTGNVYVGTFYNYNNIFNGSASVSFVSTTSLNLTIDAQAAYGSTKILGQAVISICP